MYGPSVARLGHIGVVVRDLDQTVDFYTRLLGLSLTERFEYGDSQTGHGTGVRAGAFVRCGSEHHCISFFVLRGEALDGNAGVGLHHIAFEMRTPKELTHKLAQLRDADVPIVNARRGGPGNQPRFYARDPDGNLLEFYWGIDSIGWQGQPRPYGPIEEIDLAEFDFDEFVARRERDAETLAKPA